MNTILSTRCEYSEKSADKISLEENVEKVLFSPKLKRSVIDSENKDAFEKDTEILNTVKLKPKKILEEERHLLVDKEIRSLTDQSGTRIQPDCQVPNSGYIDGYNGHNIQRIVKKFDNPGLKTAFFARKDLKYHNYGKAPKGGGA